MSKPAKWGPEFLVNSSTFDSQHTPSITALPDGRFVVAWTDNSRYDDTRSDARAQIFAADGSPLGAEFLLNTTTAGHQMAPSVTALSDGRFVAVWNNDYDSITAQIFNADGTKAGGEIAVSHGPTTDAYDPVVTALANGAFVVSWSEERTDAGSYDAVGRAFSSAGTPYAGKFLLHATSAGEQHSPVIASLDGGFAAIWCEGTVTTGFTLRMQLFLGGHKSGPEIPVGERNGFGQSDPVAAKLADGRIVVVWIEDSHDGGSLGVRGQVFNADGTPSGGPFDVAVTGTSDTGGASNPTVAALADGRFVVAWEDAKGALGDSRAEAVHAQVFAGDGTKAGKAFLVNTTVAGAQGEPTVTALADGRFVVAWTDRSGVAPDTSLEGIRAQIFDPRESGIDLPGTRRADDFIGTRFSDRIAGGDGDDRIAGGLGKDRLSGGAGDDVFVFDSRLNPRKNVDTITDFSDGNDTIWLDNAVFKGIGKAGSPLKAKYFEAGRKADDRKDHILYDRKSGTLSYDRDGTGHKDPVKFAVIDKGLKLTADDFFVM